MWSGEIPHPTAESNIFTALCSAKPGALPQVMGCFPHTIYGIQERSGEWHVASRGLDRELYGQALRMQLWHHGFLAWAGSPHQAEGCPTAGSGAWAWRALHALDVSWTSPDLPCPLHCFISNPLPLKSRMCARSRPVRIQLPLTGVPMQAQYGVR